MPIQLFERRVVEVKIEGTYGTDSVPTGAANSVLSFDGQVAIEADKLDRKRDMDYFGGDPFLLVGKRVMIEFDVEMIGASSVGTAAPIAPVLRACAHGETLVGSTSATYNPISTAFQSVSVYFYHAGIRFKVTGVRGTIDWKMQIKGWCRGRVKLTGLINFTTNPSETAPTGNVYTAFQTPPVVETETLSVTLGGVALNVDSIDFTQGNDVKIFEGSESREATIVERMPTGVVRVYQEVLATFNPWSIANAYTNQAIVAAVNGGAGKITTLNVPLAQLEYPRLTNKDGAMLWEIPFVAKPNAGNDEYTWVFT